MEQLHCVICSSEIENSEPENVEDADVVVAESDGDEGVVDGNNITTVLNLLLKTSPDFYCTPAKTVNSNSMTLDTGQVLVETFKNLEALKFSVCSECHVVTRGALKSRLRAEQMEVEVMRLQRKLLELLQGLQAEMGVFGEEMSKLEDIIVIKSSQVEKDEKKKNGYLQYEEVQMVRNEILEAVTSLRLFQADLQDKLIVNRVEDQSMLEVSTHEVEVDVVPDVKVEHDLHEEMEEEETSFMNDLINFDGFVNRIETSDVDPSIIVKINDDASMDNGEGNRYVGHMVGLEENITTRYSRRSHQWKEDMPFVCNYCGESVPTQNRLTRHLKNVHGRLRDDLIPQQLKRPPIRFNNAAVSSEILSKALNCMTKNVDDKDRNTKTLEERKRDRKEKMAMLRAQWKTIKKDYRRGNMSVSPPTKKKVAAVKPKIVSGRKSHLQKIRQTEAIPLPPGEPEKTPVLALQEAEDVTLPPATNNALPSVTPKKGAVKKFKVGYRPPEPLRRSTRGHSALDMKELLQQQEIICNRGRKKKTEDEAIAITETET